MTSLDSNADTPPSKYSVRIGEGQGIVIGDNAHVVQQFYGPQTEPQVDLAAAEAIYRQKVVDVYKWLDFSGFAHPDLSLANVPLEDVFVRLTLTAGEVSRESWHESGQRQVELCQALSNHLLIVGEPGAGKSTLLRWLAVTFAQGHQREPDRLGPSADVNRLPVLVELGRLPDRYVKPEGGEAPNWLRFLPEYFTAQMAFTNTPPQLLTQALADGRCLLLFDGLDEVADRQARTRLVRSLVELARLSLGNLVIIGSRPAGVSEGAFLSSLSRDQHEDTPKFQRCQIERFKPEDVQRFFHFWYALDRSLTTEQQHNAADALYARVQATPATLHLASTPLLSTILILIWRNEGDLPERRIELYERCCRVLIEHWEASHDVAYRGVLADMDWEDHLHLLTPLAYFIHNEEQRTSATRKELVPWLAEALQAVGRYNEQGTAVRAAKQFLDALGLRSGLLQSVGDDRYSFPHLAFQEYLAARHIAAQPDPEYIDLVMAHLNEVWWQEVHLLTIAHLASRCNEGAAKASNLLLTILRVYKPPNWILRPSVHRWARMIGPGKFLPWLQLERRIAWTLAREFELAIRGYAECATDVRIPAVDEALSTRAVPIMRDIVHVSYRTRAQENLLTALGLLQRQGKKAVAEVVDALDALSKDWHEAVVYLDPPVVITLRAFGAWSNEEVVSALLNDLHDTHGYTREVAASYLGQREITSEIQLNQVLVAFNRTLHDGDSVIREAVLKASRQLLDNRPIPGYRWVPLRKRRAQRLRLKRVTFWLGVTAFMVLIGLAAATWLLCAFNPNGYLVRFLAVLASIIAFVAAVAQVLGRKLHGQRDHS